jgi:hypothetical protein
VHNSHKVIIYEGSLLSADFYNKKNTSWVKLVEKTYSFIY